MRLPLFVTAIPALLACSAAAFAFGPPTPAQDRQLRFFSAENPDGPLVLLLPLSGAQAAVGRAVRDGFLAAAASAGAAVRVHDAGSSSDSALEGFRRALHEEPSVIIGPLHKDAVAAISAQGPSAPWLALNYLEPRMQLERMVQFGLAPEDEARAAAEHAHAQGLRRALALVPQTTLASDWGARALQAFAARLIELGGAVVSEGRYTVGESNFAVPIKLLLGLDQSTERHRALDSLLGARSQFEPRRRDDADFLFIAARASDGRQLWPQLRFHRSGDLPVYATSAIYEGRSDSELNGLRVCDMPYLSDATGSYAKLRGEVEGLNSARQQPRLFALGYDAYAVAARMRSGELNATPGFAAATGTLTLANGAIQRRLGCAAFRDGRPSPPSKS